MIEHVVKAIRWKDAQVEGGGYELDACAFATARYRPGRNEPMVSLIVPSYIADRLTVQVRLHRHEKKVEVLLAEVPAIAFIETIRNRLPFHGTVDERDEYEVEFLNVSNSTLYLIAAILVSQP